MIGSWRRHTTGTSQIPSKYWASGISTVVCVHRHVHDLLESLLLHSFLQRLDSFLTAAARSACVLPEFTQSGFNSNQPSSGRGQRIYWTLHRSHAPWEL